MDSYLTTPAGAAALSVPDQRPLLAKGLSSLPKTVLTMASSPQTGAFIRGLVKVHKLDEDYAGTVALQVLHILLGDKDLAQLPSLLSSDLKIPNDKSQQMAQEIEKELFAPISMDLNKYLAEKKKAAGSVVNKTTGPRPSNVLDLKDTKRPPAPPPVPLQ